MPAAVAVATLVSIAGAQNTPEDVPVPSRLEAASAMVESVIAGAIEGARSAPNDGAAWLHLAKAYHANAYYVEAEACYLEAIELGEESAEAWHLLTHVRESRADDERALEAAARSIELDPDNAYIHWRRGDLLFDLGRLDEAEGAYWDALAVDAGHEGARIGLVRVYLQRRRPGEAIAIIEDGLLDGLNGKYARLLLGSAYMQAGRRDEAATEMARGRGARPMFPDPRVNDLHTLSTGYVNEMNRVLTLLRKGDHEQVLAETETLSEHFPTDALVLEYRASSLWAMGRRQEAAQTWQRAMQVDPGNYHPHLSFARTISKGVPPNSRVFNLALQHAVRATMLNPNDAESHELVGTLHGFAGRTSRAITSLEAAAEADPKRSTALGKLGELYIQSGRHEEAVGVLERVTALEPDAGGAYVLLTIAALESSQVELARRSFAEAERLMPGNPQVNQLRARLARIDDGGAP